MAPPQLRIRGLEVRYHRRGRPALAGVDLDVAPGEFVAVLGRSGAGKSTLVRCVNRLVEPSAGRVEFEGQSVSAFSGQALFSYRRQVGMIFQNFNLIDRLDALDNVLVGRFGSLPLWRVVTRAFPEADVARARAALRRVGIEHLAHQRASRLSGGQRQRVAIARALVQEPKLLLGDEPVSNLDPVTARSVMRLLEEINGQDGITMVINLHSVDLAQAFATRVIGVANGRIVFDGPPDRLNDVALQQIYGSDEALDRG